MISDDPGPGQKYAIMARKNIATLHAKEPGVRVENRWCPYHQGVEGDEAADEWAKQAAEEPDAHGVEWLNFTDPHGIVRKRRFPPSPTSSEIPQTKMDGDPGPGQQEARQNQQHRPSAKETGPDGGSLRAIKLKPLARYPPKDAEILRAVAGMIPRLMWEGLHKGSLMSLVKIELIHLQFQLQPFVLPFVRLRVLPLVRLIPL